MDWRSVVTLVAVLAAQTPPPASTPEALVRGMLAAFNAHDVARMLTFVATDVRWLTIDGDKVAVEASGAVQLEQSMTRYFRSIPSSRSELTSLSVSGPFVTTVEAAQWQAAGQARRQCSVAIYEIREGTIKTVWYFPAHRCD